MPDTITMRAITLHQPWAGWIALGLKTIETRRHQRFFHLGGEIIAIHAGKKFNPAGFDGRFRDVVAKDEYVALTHTHGAILCTAYIFSCGRLAAQHSRAALCDCSDCPGVYDPLYGLFLQDIRPLVESFPCRGYQGAWRVEIPTELLGGGSDAQAST